MADFGTGITMTDGSLDFSGGVDSLKVTTIQSQQNPNGLARNELSWLVNATVRDGGILQRLGWQPVSTIIPAPATPFYQGAYMYEPTDGSSFPYFIAGFGGHIYKIDPNNPSATVDLSMQFGVFHPAAPLNFFFCQAEEFLVIQAGDGVTLPLFWDGTTLRRSRGLLGASAISGATPTTYGITLTNVSATPGYVFSAQAGSNNPLGSPYATFTAPAIGANVTVTLSSPSTLTAGATVTFPIATTGNMQLIQIQHIGANWLYTYNNLSIPAGTNVPAQYAPSTTPGDGATFPAFTAPTIGANFTFTFGAQLVNPGLVNVWSFNVNFSFTVQSVNGGESDTQQHVSEIPSATAMDYYMGRLWYAQGKFFAAGDIVYGVYGTSFYNYRDSVLKVTENPLALGGDGFAVPSNEGNIRAIFHTANLNTQLGQGPLFIGTRKAIYQLQVPVTRTDWIAANNNTQPLLTVAQLFYGPVNDRSIVKVNSDAYYQTLEPAIRSHFMSLRDFQQWANVPISSNVERVLAFNDRSLLHASTGILWDNRIWQSMLPRQVPQGIVHDAVAVLDFTPISSFGQNEQPTWEGIYQGIPIFQMFNGDFGGRERAFGFVLAQDNSVALWEFTDSTRNEDGDKRVTWVIEFPAYTFGKEFLLKRLDHFELWIDKLYGTVNFQMDYRPDGEACWQEWFAWKECSARNSCEDVANPVCYPLVPYREGFRQTIVSPRPKQICTMSSNRPSDIGYQFQVRLTIHGWCRVRGLLLHALPVEKAPYAGIVC